MKISALEIYQYDLPLNQFLVNGTENRIERQGLILRLVAGETEGFGEVAPLPGRSRETFARALEQLKEFKLNLIGAEVAAKLAKLDGGFSDWLEPLGLYPSVRFGIEMAVLNLLANAKKVTLSHLLDTASHDQIKVKGLVQGNKDAAVKQTKEMLTQGFTTIKLKVGGNINDEIAKVRAVNEVIDGHALLSLDANQAWDLKKAVTFGNEVGCAAVEYIEEPFRDVTQIPDFFMQTTIPVALDESLQGRDFQEIKSIDGVYTLVLKPTLLGSIEKTRTIMVEAKHLALDTVISSSFESAIGLLALASIAGCSHRDRPAGLDTLKWFKQNLLKDELTMHKGRLNIAHRCLNSSDINFSLLKKMD